MGLRKPKLNVGKKMATGTSTQTAISSLTVRGLSFRPSTVIVSDNNDWYGVYNNRSGTANFATTKSGTSGTITAPTMYDDGFTVQFINGSSYSGKISWVAYE